MSGKQAGKDTCGEYSPAAGEPIDAEGEVAEIPAELAGSRLDAAAAQLFPDYSRARLQAWITSGDLRVNGMSAVRPRDPVRAGDRLELRVPAPTDDSRVAAQPMDLQVVYEDAALAVINKPAGLTVHPGAGQADGTLQNALLHRYPETAAVPRAGLVHRLDKDTSGLLVVARTLPAHTRLVAMLAVREIRREYDALVHGRVTAGGRVDLPIGRDPRHRTRMAVLAGGRHAVTHYSVIRRFVRHTWLRVRLETGRTHQIRVHMARLRHPLIGDAAYGGRRGGIDAVAGFRRQALHARILSFQHPLREQALHFDIEMPEDMLRLLAALNDHDKHTTADV